MVNAVDIVVSVLIGLIVIAVSFYLFTMYCHRNSPLIQLSSAASAMPSFPKSWWSHPKP
jgi:hypothetical protein